MLLSARLSLIIAASSIGVRLGAISESTNAAIILVAALTAMFAPLGFNSLMAAPDEKRRRTKLIYGGSELAIQVGKELRAHGDDVLVIDTDSESAQRLRAQGFDVVNSDRPLSTIMESMRDVYVDAFIALSLSDDRNLDACRVARTHGVDHILSFVAEPIRVPDFRGLGVQSLTPSLHRSSLLALMARNPAIFSLLTSTEDQRDLREFIVFNSDLQGKRLMDLKIPADALVLAIRRADELIIPHGTTKLATGDHLTILGNLDSLTELEEMLEKW
jgi:Trk K+ transport system NAD-binding subunit